MVVTDVVKHDVFVLWLRCNDVQSTIGASKIEQSGVDVSGDDFRIPAA